MYCSGTALLGSMIQQHFHTTYTHKPLHAKAAHQQQTTHVCICSLCKNAADPLPACCISADPTNANIQMKGKVVQESTKHVALLLTLQKHQNKSKG